MFKQQYARLPKPFASTFDSPLGLSCLTVLYPNSAMHLALLQGIIANLTNPDFWQGTDSEIDAMSDLWLTAYTETDWSTCLTSQWLLGNTRVYPEMAIATDGNALSWADVTGQAYGGVFRQNAPAINDKLTWNVALKAGSYVMNVNGIKANNRGIQTIKLDGVTAGTFDWYNSTTQLNQQQNTVIGVTDDGLYELTSEMATKNASSSNYFLLINYIDFLRV